MSQASFDLVLAGGRVIDPASGTDAIYDVAVKDGRIAAVGEGLAGNGPGETVDAAGLLVVPGLIDTHAHVFQHVSGRFGLNADLCGVRSGVTTLVDQGGPSCMTFPAFRHFIAEPATSRVLAFVSIYVVGGLEGHYYPELYGPGGIDVDACVRTAKSNADLVKGIKAHAESGGMSRWGLETLKLARRAGDETGLPVYVHLGQLWPERAGDEGSVDIDEAMPDIVALLREGDILAHPFTRHPGGFVSRNGQVHPVIAAALDRGLRVDVGHGSHFSFAMAQRVLEAGIRPFTVGADMHGYNTHVPHEGGTPDDHPDDEMHLFAGQTKFSLCHAMTELLAMGVPLADVVAMSTANCATAIGMSDTLGALAPGRGADVSVLRLEKGRWTLSDNSGDSIETTERIVPVFCLRDGVRFAADAPILPN
jgi:dihydroorotase